MFQTKITRREDTLAALATQLQKAPLLMQTRARVAVMPLAEQMREILATTPGPSHRPVIWTSAKQRRAYFATNGFGQGIPYRRSGKLQQGWRVELVPDDKGGEIIAYNEVPYTRWVQGASQQIQHYATGWVEAIPTVAAFEARLDDALVDAWFDVCEFITEGK